MRNFELSHCTEALYGEPWAIMPAKLEALVQVLSARKSGEIPSAEELEKLLELADKRASASSPGARVRDVAGMRVRQVGSVAILPMYGTITQRPSTFSRYSGGTSAEQFASAHAELVADDAVSAVIWDVDSPGGSVSGVPEAAERLLSLRGKKPTVAVSNSMMASAAYWLASAADEISASPSSLTGSIGVYTMHEDYSRQNAVQGVTVTYVYAGKKKVDGNPDSPLSEPARTSLQEMVDDYYGQFVVAVAKHRRTSENAVRNGYGEGDAITATRAMSAGLVDRIETLSVAVSRMSEKAKSSPFRSMGMASARMRMSKIDGE